MIQHQTRRAGLLQRVRDRTDLRLGLEVQPGEHQNAVGLQRVEDRCAGHACEQRRARRDPRDGHEREADVNRNEFHGQSESRLDDSDGDLRTETTE